MQGPTPLIATWLARAVAETSAKSKLPEASRGSFAIPKGYFGNRFAPPTCRLELTAAYGGSQSCLAP